jgi:hypothetical protein
MIQSACLQMETAQQFPYAAAPKAVPLQEISAWKTRDEQKSLHSMNIGSVKSRWSRIVG